MVGKWQRSKRLAGSRIGWEKQRGDEQLELAKSNSRGVDEEGRVLVEEADVAPRWCRMHNQLTLGGATGFRRVLAMLKEQGNSFRLGGRWTC